MKHVFTIAALLLTAFALATPAYAQRDAVLGQAREAGLIGEQADGYLGFVPNAQISADLRGRVEQNNIRRRAAYSQTAEARNATVVEVGAAVACEVFEDAQRLRLGEHYRDANGQWRQFTASQPVAVPPICGRS